MSVIIKASNPNTLLNAIYRTIDEGGIDTWSYDNDGDLTHSVAQWNKIAWMRPKIESWGIVFFIIGRKNFPVSRQEYAIYHGRFAEMLVTHCYKYCDSNQIIITPLPTEYDRVK